MLLYMLLLPLGSVAAVYSCCCCCCLLQLPLLVLLMLPLRGIIMNFANEGLRLKSNGLPIN